MRVVSRQSLYRIGSDSRVLLQKRPRRWPQRRACRSATGPTPTALTLTWINQTEKLGSYGISGPR